MNRSPVSSAGSRELTGATLRCAALRCSRGLGGGVSSMDRARILLHARAGPIHEKEMKRRQISQASGRAAFPRRPYRATTIRQAVDTSVTPSDFRLCSPSRTLASRTRPRSSPLATTSFRCSGSSARSSSCAPASLTRHGAARRRTANTRSRRLSGAGNGFHGARWFQRHRLGGQWRRDHRRPAGRALHVSAFIIHSWPVRPSHSQPSDPLQAVSTSMSRGAWQARTHACTRIYGGDVPPACMHGRFNGTTDQSCPITKSPAVRLVRYVGGWQNPAAHRLNLATWIGVPSHHLVEHVSLCTIQSCVPFQASCCSRCRWRTQTLG